MSLERELASVMLAAGVSVGAVASALGLVPIEVVWLLAEAAG